MFITKLVDVFIRNNSQQISFEEIYSEPSQSKSESESESESELKLEFEFYCILHLYGRRHSLHIFLFILTIP